MTLTDRKGNIRGREFPTDTGIDGNACEETAKDQRWVGLCRQIPDTDTRPTSLFLSPSCSFSSCIYLSLSLSFSRSPYKRLTSRHRQSTIRPFARTTRLTVYTHRNTHCHKSAVRRSTNFHGRWESVRAPFPVEATAAAGIAPRPLSLTTRCLMIPGTSKSTRPIPIR